MRNMRLLLALAIAVALMVAGLAFAGNNTQALVYITGSSNKYHTKDCSALGQSKTAITLEEAKDRGYRPHRYCKAPN